MSFWRGITGHGNSGCGIASYFSQFPPPVFVYGTSLRFKSNSVSVIKICEQIAVGGTRVIERFFREVIDDETRFWNQRF